LPRTMQTVRDPYKTTGLATQEHSGDGTVFHVFFIGT